VTAFGVIFDCKLLVAQVWWKLMKQSKRMDRELLASATPRKLIDRGLKIQSPKSMVKEQWFIDAIKDTPDYLYVSARVPRSPS
jgi:hypothetical protein